MRSEKIEAIRTANEYIENLIIGVNEVSEKMYAGNEREGFELIPQIAEGLEYIYKIVVLTENVFGKVEDIERLNGFFGEIVEAIENEDCILIGDLYKYEIVPILEEIKGAFMKSLAN